jgi:hypothetical protein
MDAKLIRFACFTFVAKGLLDFMLMYFVARNTENLKHQ